MTITAYVPASTYHPTTQVFDDAEATANLVRTGLETLSDNAKFLLNRGNDLLYTDDNDNLLASTTAANIWAGRAINVNAISVAAGQKISVNCLLTCKFTGVSSWYNEFRLTYSVAGSAAAQLTGARRRLNIGGDSDLFEVSLFGEAIMPAAGGLYLVVQFRNTSTAAHIPTDLYGPMTSLVQT